MSKATSWIQAFRPKTLTAAVVPIAVAVALTHLNDLDIIWWAVGCMLVSAVSIQIATNLFNDAIDFKKGADQERQGPLRVTQAGIFSPRQVYAMALLFCGIALVAGVPLVLHAGWPLIIIGVGSLFLAYGYTGGPYPLAYRGLGDLFVVLFFGIIAVMGSYFVLTQQWTLPALILGLQVGFLSTVLIAINNLRDSAGDKKVGKRTLAVRFGDQFVVGEIMGLIIVSFLMCLFWVMTYDRPLFLVFLLALPLAIKIIKNVRDVTHKQKLGPTLGMSALLHVLFGVSFCVACLL